jgi:hypothetical protein
VAQAAAGLLYGASVLCEYSAGQPVRRRRITEPQGVLELVPWVDIDSQYWPKYLLFYEPVVWVPAQDDCGLDIVPCPVAIVSTTAPTKLVKSETSPVDTVLSSSSSPSRTAGQRLSGM